MNSVILSGRLTRDPEIREFGGNGKRMAKFTLAVERRFAGRGEDKRADFFPCTLFGAQVDFVERFIHKGSRVEVRGRLQQSSYTTAAGEQRSTLEVIVEDVEFGETKQARSEQTPAPAPERIEEAGWHKVPAMRWDDLGEDDDEDSELEGELPFH